MRYEHCLVRHDPANGTYGDCLRACVASIMDMDSQHVPHFADAGADATVAMRWMGEWLRTYECAPFIVAYPGDISLAELLDMHRTINPDSVYILFGGTGGGDHCVVCRGGQVIHNPAWIGSRIIGPLSNDTWQVLIVGRV